MSPGVSLKEVSTSGITVFPCPNGVSNWNVIRWEQYCGLFRLTCFESVQASSALCQSFSNRIEQSRLAWLYTRDIVHSFDSQMNAKWSLIRSGKANRANSVRPKAWWKVSCQDGSAFTSACMTWRSQHTRQDVRTLSAAKEGWRGWAPSPGGQQSATVTGSRPSLPPRAVKWKGPALEQAHLWECVCVCECVCRGSNLVCAGGYGLFDVINSLCSSEKPGGSQSTSCHMPHCLSSKIWWWVASSRPAPAALSSYNNLRNLWRHKWPCNVLLDWKITALKLISCHWAENTVTCKWHLYCYANVFCALTDSSGIRFPETSWRAQSSEIIAAYWRERESWEGDKFNSNSTSSEVDGSWMQIKFCFSVLWFITVPSRSAGAGGVLNGMTRLTYWKSNSTTKHRKNRARQMDNLQSSLVGIGRGICLES